MEPVRLIVDTDTALGVDGGEIGDALALAFLAGQPTSVQIVGMTVVAGSVSLASASRSTRFVCGILRMRTDIAEGLHCPVDKRPLITAHSMLLNQADAPENWVFDREPAIHPCGIQAWDYIAAKAEQAPLDILALGPLSNIAAFVHKYPQRKGAIRRIVMVGGNFAEGAAKPEFNMKTDPVAAKMVFNSGIPVVVVPFDITSKTRLKTEDIAPWKVVGRSGKYFYQGASNWLGHLRRCHSQDSCNLHEPVGAHYVVESDYYESAGIVPEIDTRTGRTSVKEWNESSPVRLVQGFHAEAFHRMFFQTLNNITSQV